MPQIKSAKKRVLVTERNRQRNMAYKSAVRTAVKNVLAAISDEQEPTAVSELLKTAYSLIDRSVVKGILHKSTGARMKSRLTKAVNKVEAAA